MREKEKGESQDERRVHVPPVLEGRLRIRLPGVKGAAANAVRGDGLLEAEG